MLPSPKGMRLFVLLAASLVALSACQQPQQLPAVAPSAVPAAFSETGSQQYVGASEFSPDGRWLLWQQMALDHNGAPATTVAWSLFDTQSGTQRRLWQEGVSGLYSAVWADDGSLISIELR